MVDGISMDVSDLLKVVAQLGNVKDEIPKGATAAMRGAAFTAKAEWQKGLESSDVPASASTIRYRFGGGAGQVTATVENKLGTPRLQGYVHAREFGSVTVAPGIPAAIAAGVAANDLAKGLAIAGERAIERALES